MSLLTNPFFSVGAGLLQSSGPSLTPVNPWGGVTKGLLAANQARAYEQDMEANKMRLAMLQAQQERLGRQNEWASGQDDPMAALFPELFARANIEARFREPADSWSDPYEINAGGKPVMVQQNTATGQLKAIGGGGVTVNTGDMQKPLGADSVKWRNESGENPDPMLTTEQAVGMGFRPISDYESKLEARTATIDADRRELLAQKQRAEQAYAEAQAAFDANENATTKRNLDNAAEALRTAIAGLENWRGEPSEGVADRFTVPGAGGIVIERAINRLLNSGQENEPSIDDLVNEYAD